VPLSGGKPMLILILCFSYPLLYSVNSVNAMYGPRWEKRKPYFYLWPPNLAGQPKPPTELYLQHPPVPALRILSNISTQIPGLITAPLATMATSPK
jgi:hypothetical protein